MPEQMVRIDFNVDEVKRSLKWLAKSQFPFAYARTLTDTARACKQAVGIQARRVFKLHGEFIPRSIRIQAARKSDVVRMGFAEAAVFTGHKLDGWIGLQEWGGTKTPFASRARDKGRSLALPTRDLSKMSYKTKTGRIKKRLKPSTLLKNFRGSSSYGKIRVREKGTATKKAFIVRARDGTPMIVRRKTRSQYPLQILYTFEKKGKVKPKWGFVKTCERVANAVIHKKFARHLRAAIASI